MSKRPGVMVYKNIRPAVENLSDQQAGKLFKAILACDEESPDFHADPVLAVVWAMLQPALEADALRYQRTTEARSLAGKRSGEVRRAMSEASAVEEQHPSTNVPNGEEMSTESTNNNINNKNNYNNNININSNINYKGGDAIGPRPHFTGDDFRRIASLPLEQQRGAYEALWGR